MKTVNANDRTQKGFTIVELMIALTVMATLLAMAAVVLIQVGKLYSKGVNTANAQNASRNIVYNIGSMLQFSGKAPYSCTSQAGSATCAARSASSGSKTVYSYCIGTTRFSYILNSRLSDNPTGTETRHVLWQDTMSSDAFCYPLDIATAAVPSTCAPGTPVGQCGATANSGKELVPSGTRLGRFVIQPISAGSNIYGIDAWLAYGDDDLVDVTGSGNCAPGQGGRDGCAGFMRCLGGFGQEYCAVSQLSTTVVRRLE